MKTAYLISEEEFLTSLMKIVEKYAERDNEEFKSLSYPTLDAVTETVRSKTADVGVLKYCTSEGLSLPVLDSIFERRLRIVGVQLVNEISSNAELGGHHIFAFVTRKDRVSRFSLMFSRDINGVMTGREYYTMFSVLPYFDREGLLTDVSSVITTEWFNIENLGSRPATYPNQAFYFEITKKGKIYPTLEDTLEETSRISQRVKLIPGIKDVSLLGTYQSPFTKR